MRQSLMLGTMMLGFVFAGMQVVPTPARSTPVNESGLQMTATVDPRVGAILDRSCQDCHSDRTHWPWYGYVAPVSWILAWDVSQGREKLDLSQWERRPDSANERTEICNAISDGSMPPRTYTMLHRDSALSEREVDLVCAWAASAHESGTEASGSSGAASDEFDRRYPPTAVRSRSWLRHLGLKVSQTRMGQMGGTQPAAWSPHRELTTETLNRSFLLTGADLYRLNCQACHGPDGKGAPPEISSLITPVQGTSLAFVKRRMETRGAPIDDEFANQLAGQAETALRSQIENGSEKMPPFRSLREDEVEALVNYLRMLAGVASPTDSSLLVRESAARVGEHVVEGTCHICHVLSSLQATRSLSSVERQVQQGSPPMKRMMKVIGGEAMPAYPYFTDEEIAAAYYYLGE